MSSVYPIIPTPRFELKVNHSILSKLAIETALNVDNVDDDDDDDDDVDDDDNNNNANLNLVRT